MKNYFALIVLLFFSATRSANFDNDQLSQTKYPLGTAWIKNSVCEILGQDYTSQITVNFIPAKLQAWAVEYPFVVHVSEYDLERIDTICAQKNPSAEEKQLLQSFKGVLAHECGHITYDNPHLYTKIGTGIGLSLLSWHLYAQASKYNTSFLDTPTTLITLTLGFITYRLYVTGTVIDSHINENQADDFVIKTKSKELIEGFKLWLQEVQSRFSKTQVFHDVETMLDVADEFNDNKILRNFFLTCAYLISLPLTPHHPPIQFRIKKMETALDILEQQELQFT